VKAGINYTSRNRRMWFESETPKVCDVAHWKALDIKTITNNTLSYRHSRCCNLPLFNRKLLQTMTYLSKVGETVFSCNIICCFLSTWYMHSKLIQVHCRLFTMSEWQKRHHQIQARNTPLPMKPHLEWSSAVFKPRTAATTPRILSVIIQVNILESTSQNKDNGTTH